MEAWARVADFPSNNSKRGLNSADVSSNSESPKKKLKMYKMSQEEQEIRMTLHKHSSAASTKGLTMETEIEIKDNRIWISHGRRKSYVLSAVVAASLCSFSLLTLYRQLFACFFPCLALIFDTHTSN